ncbi:unnamed protein product [Caenorhabditis nigoni]
MQPVVKSDASSDSAHCVYAPCLHSATAAQKTHSSHLSRQTLQANNAIKHRLPTTSFAHSFSKFVFITRKMNFRKGTILNQRYVYEQFAGSYYNVLSFNAFDKQKDEQVLVKGYAMNDPRVNAHVTFFERCDGIKGVPKMVEVFDMDGNTFIVLGHEGIPLGSILRDSLFHCSMENTYRIGFRLFRIIHSVHRHNFVIRDIRPQSIRCMVDDSEELQVSLSNFGLSAPISPPPLQPSGDNPIANGMFQSLSAIRGNPYVPIDDYIAVVFVMLDCQGVNPFNANANQHMTLLQKKERFHSNPYGFLPEACQWIADIYLLLEGMREDGNFKHIDVMSLLNKAVPGVKAQSAITFRHNPANGHLLID